MLEKNSKIFVVTFFAAIFLSIAHTYYVIVIKRDFAVYSNSDNIPLPADMYVQLYKSITKKVRSIL